MKNIVNQLRHRAILQFDYSGEWSLSRYPNTLSKDCNQSFHLYDMISINDLGYHISEYDDPEDWLSMGFSGGASVLMPELAKLAHMHGNDWSSFRKLVLSYCGQPYYFNKNNGTSLPNSVNASTLQSIMKMMHYIEPVFNRKFTQYNIAKLILYSRHININLKLNVGNVSTEKRFARIIVGKTLKKMLKVLHIVKPVVVVEEADLLMPPSKDDEYISSAIWLVYYILKLRRTGCMIILITQHESLCDKVAAQHYDYKIALKMRPFWSDRGLFTFAARSFYSTGKGSSISFMPLDSSSMYENHPLLT